MTVFLRVLGAIAGLVLAALVLVLLAVAFVEGLLKLAGLLGVQHSLGMDTQTSHQYASVSGVLPMLVAALGFSGLLIGFWKHINCVEPGCPWPGRHPDSTGRKWCWRHHPDHHGERPTSELLHQLHHEAKHRDVAPKAP